MKVFRVTIPVIMMVPEDHNRAICGIDSDIDEDWAFESAIHLSDTIEDAISNYGFGRVEIDGITAAELRSSASNERCQDSPKSTLDSIQSEIAELRERLEDMRQEALRKAAPSLEDSPFQVGDRIVFVQPWDIYPCTVIKAGEKGRIIKKGEDCLDIMLDNHTEGLEEWDNVVHFDDFGFSYEDGESILSYIKKEEIGS